MIVGTSNQFSLKKADSLKFFKCLETAEKFFVWCKSSIPFFFSESKKSELLSSFFKYYILYAVPGQ